MKLHLHQYLSRTGIFSRKKFINESVKKGEITVNDKVITNPMYRFNPEKNIVKMHNKILKVVPKKYYFVINKPEGYLSTRLTPKDIQLNKKSVFDLLKLPEEISNTLFAVGRLDENTTGLLIITNDGKLGFKITNPNSKIEKKYLVKLKNPCNEKALIESGVVIVTQVDNINKFYKTKPCKVELLTQTELVITLIEGKKREVRKIFEAVGNKVEQLERIAIGNVKFKLKKGQYIEVTRNDIRL